ncbi:MAG: hypothetical protein IJO29_05465 [Oscillospiraceae bacterium]|nr:hypothetical protein [Oscillospiraceae bacterium]
MLEMKNCSDILKYQSAIPCECVAPLILESVDNDTVSGYIIFECFGNESVIYAVDFNGDIALCDGLVRAAMFKAYLSGIKNAKFSLCDSKAADACRKLGFIKNDQSTIDIDAVLNGCKGCKGS